MHQRAHQLGSERVFGNRDLAGQYAALMDVLGYRTSLGGGDWLAVTYYLLLQDRVEEALEAFAKVDADAVETAVQYDYLSAYLCFFTGDVATARRLATRRAEHPATHWRARFREVLAQLDEAEGKPRDRGEEQTPQTLAATAPALELAVAGRDVAISYANRTFKLVGCKLAFLKGDLEAKFTEGMTWENHGEWHIDHIKPCCSFDLTKEEEQIKCFHYSNLQPLSSTISSTVKIPEIPPCSSITTEILLC